MKIVVTDGATLNPGDLSWDALGALGAYTVHPRSSPEENLERCREADAVITNKVVFDKSVILALPRLRYIGVAATGYNIVDTQAATERGVVVTNVPTYGTLSVAQMVFAHLLELAHHVGHHDRTVHEGRWAASRDFCYWDYPLIELAGLTLGVVGCGRIGEATARLAEAFGMKTQGYDPGAAVPGSGLRRVDLDTLFATSDVVSLHCPLTPESRELVNSTTLGRMKKTAFLINTSRGPLVNERDLADALSTGRIAGAAVDVLSTEPPRPDNPLLAAPNCIITPHIAWATHAARGRLLDATVDNLRAYLAGKPTNVVTGTKGG